MDSNIIWNDDIAMLVSRKIIDDKAYLVYPENNQSDWVVWTNGVKCPVYLNCRFIFGRQESFRFISSLFECMVSSSFTNYDIFVGLATAGIPIAAILALKFNKPFAYVRSAQKLHGVGGLVEGKPDRNLRALLIDDTLASGGSIIAAMLALENEYKIKTTGIAAIGAMSEYGFENCWGEFKKKKINVKVLTNYKYLEEVAIEKGLMTVAQADKLNCFYKSPANYIW